MGKAKSPKIPPAAQPAASTNEKAEPCLQQVFWLLKTGTAPKLGKQSQGGIHYRVLCEPERQQLTIGITGNDGGGYFSRELVPFSKVNACVQSRAPDQPFPSKLFKAAFVGRSSNNAGFLAAILRAEGLLMVAPEAETQHIVGGDWTAWQASMLAEAGEKVEIEASIPGKKQGEDWSQANGTQTDENHQNLVP